MAKLNYIFEGKLRYFLLRSSSTYPILYGEETPLEVALDSKNNLFFNGELEVKCIKNCSKCSGKVKFSSSEIQEGHDGIEYQVKRWEILVLNFSCLKCNKNFKYDFAAKSEYLKMINAYYPEYNLAGVF